MADGTRDCCDPGVTDNDARVRVMTSGNRIDSVAATAVCEISTAEVEMKVDDRRGGSGQLMLTGSLRMNCQHCFRTFLVQPVTLQWPAAPS